ncbi:hypothetical protein [Paeniglutamicibacter terrestris]|uniref:Hydroxymethylpyrimidine pyrophosphatase n=1 Tax=Paeniglutamicibacter terrestris TaxID=2723403 RepID=A0ABX1G2N0_9MICC|nr:hypothetical protein [Paeniglutamicibacter terrestris]ASN37636.1 hypothetical protein CGQ24_00510 [Arthrobacter sp. 7749]NKG20199.1 hypothetical protein [Paeniglutamicibacter terrestris]
MPQTPPFALLLDVDGPIASPVTRDVTPEIISLLLDLAGAGIPVIFNTGRSDEFIKSQVMAPMIQAGMRQDLKIHAICEKGATWFTFGSKGAEELYIDHDLAVPGAYAREIRELVATDFAEHMFFDETKRAMVSVEQHIVADNTEYRRAQVSFDAAAMEAMTRHGLGVQRLEVNKPDANNDIDYRVDPTIISTDIESVQLGKDLGARRALELLAGDEIVPASWFTVGDSRTDYAMADWLAEEGHQVSHVDVRPADGMPSGKSYPILTASDLGLGVEVIHDDAGAAFLRHWQAQLN